MMLCVQCLPGESKKPAASIRCLMDMPFPTECEHEAQAWRGAWSGSEHCGDPPRCGRQTFMKHLLRQHRLRWCEAGGPYIGRAAACELLPPCWHVVVQFRVVFRLYDTYQLDTMASVLGGPISGLLGYLSIKILLGYC